MRKSRLLALSLLLLLSALSCQALTPQTPGIIPTLQQSPLDLERTMYGFFPSPSEVSLQSVMDTYKGIGDHGDVVLLQQNIPWQEFEKSADNDSQAVTDIHNQYILAHQNNLEIIFVADPLNGLNRREFFKLPFGWQPSFGSPSVRSAFTHYVQRIVREFRPRYLGLASEINTYAEAFPQDFPHYLSLYTELYDWIKAESPETQVFVTFQWEDLNNLIAEVAEGRSPYQTNWDQVEVFEPRLDLWVISSYPFVAFPSAADIPADYYTPLLSRTAKPLAVAEGGFPSQPNGSAPGSPEDQVGYLNAIHAQIGERLTFWIYLLLSDLNLDSYARVMRTQGQGKDITTLGYFSTVGLRSFDGTSKPALEVWDSFRDIE